MPRCDVVLFCTSVDRPFSESERAFLEQITRWKKKVVVVLNKTDLLDDAPGDLHTATEYVRAAAADVLGDGGVPVFAISARGALAHKLGERATGQQPDSGFGSLERYIHDSLAGPEKIRWKLRKSHVT